MPTATQDLLSPGTVNLGKEDGVTQIRRSQVRWLGTDDPQVGLWVTRLHRNIHVANSTAWGFDWHDVNDLQFTEYHASNEGHYDWHEDNKWITTPESRVFDRKISLVVQLSPRENYSGGQFELDPTRKALNPDHFADQGDMVLFPSFLRHRVTPVSSGVRYSLVTWAEGPRFRRSDGKGLV